MIYFYHHYELPVILHRYRLRQFLVSQRTTNAHGDSMGFDSVAFDSVAFVNATVSRRNNDERRNAVGGTAAEAGRRDTVPTSGHFRLVAVSSSSGDNANVVPRRSPSSWRARTLYPLLSYSLRLNQNNLRNLENVISSISAMTERMANRIRLSSNPNNAVDVRRQRSVRSDSSPNAQDETENGGSSSASYAEEIDASAESSEEVVTTAAASEEEEVLSRMEAIDDRQPASTSNATEMDTSTESSDEVSSRMEPIYDRALVCTVMGLSQ